MSMYAQKLENHFFGTGWMPPCAARSSTKFHEVHVPDRTKPQLARSYDDVGMPRHTGKSVSRQVCAEVQGAMVDGDRGIAYPKGSKLVKYTVMAILFCQLTHCSQRQVQVICGGLVYFSTFRRQLLGSLNQCWVFIESFNKAGRHRLAVPSLVKLEILRCVCV